MSDIYEIAKEPMYQNGDYYDMSSGIIYHTADYNHAIRFGLPTAGIMCTFPDGSKGIAIKNN